MGLKRRLSGFVCAVAVAALLGGCAAADSVSESLPYPNLSTIQRIKQKILSSEEKDAEIRSLSQEKERHQEAAIKEIEKR